MPLVEKKLKKAQKSNSKSSVLKSHRTKKLNKRGKNSQILHKSAFQNSQKGAGRPHARRKNFSSFTSKIRSDKILLYLVIFTSLVLVNIPLIIDYLLMNRLLSTISAYNDSAITSKFLGSEIYSMYGLF